MTPADADLQFDCPLCRGAFEAPAELLGQEVECPHCGQAVELPTAKELPPGALTQPPEIASDVASEPAEPAEPPAATSRKPLNREERAAARRRFNLMLAIVGGAILVLAFVLLASFG